MIISRPLTPEQIQQSREPSQKDVRDAQDALFMYLFNKVAELEAKLEPQLKSSRKKAT
ncbi:MAG: hypothetical protein IJG24_03575 [Selenomonadaceae bacterium]|nr:hypothetical protein [Selenomonadaceae bacterium]